MTDIEDIFDNPFSTTSSAAEWPQPDSRERRAARRAAATAAPQAVDVPIRSKPAAKALDVSVGVVNDEMRSHMLRIGEQVKAGDLSGLEEMLGHQAVILGNTFTQFVVMSDGKAINTQAAALGVAFRAQNLCRKTVATLNEIKNPRRSATFIKNQQNNLITEGATDARAQVDTRTEAIAGSKNPQVATVAEVHRAEVVSG